MFAPYSPSEAAPLDHFEETIATGSSRSTVEEARGVEGISERPRLMPVAHPASPSDSEQHAHAPEFEAPHAREQIVDAPQPVAAPQARRAVSDATVAERVPAFVPLLSPQRNEPADRQPEAPRYSIEASSPKDARANFPAAGRSARPVREPDEIQIHIGRIEVTAVQPPAAPRAPKAPDNGLSLDAYLQRRSGRSR